MKENSPLLFVISRNQNTNINAIENETKKENEESIVSDDIIESNLLLDYTIPDEDINSLQLLGFSKNDIQAYKTNNLSTKESYINYILKGDIEIKADNLVNMTHVEPVNKLQHA